ncbi:MAG TPA: LON peptidase substrate-binding domain-containing protein, partial [Pyrinomonadaceae bacterium]|nr:LON peptidase substrate-binding domain-containing protein [Pyrinomonadaceae bacterium]
MAETRENIQAPESTKAPQVNPQQTGEANASAVPFEISVLPLQNTTLFPETVVPLAVGRPRSIASVEAALATPEKLLACISARNETVTGQEATPADLYDIGTLVMVKRMQRIDEGLHLIVQGTERIKVLEWTQEQPFLKARVQTLPPLNVVDPDAVEATKRNVQALIQQALVMLPQVPTEVRSAVLTADDPIRLAYFLASVLNLGVEQEQKMLEAQTVDEL